MILREIRNCPRVKTVVPVLLGRLTNCARSVQIMSPRAGLSSTLYIFQVLVLPLYYLHFCVH